ncbi:Protein of uncharacterised function (DUF1573) [Sphingobacterium spiritivorum]|uniref:Protein of uncharacterized function (DUF1573) n=1 Tax=Sphingobacterium spiritivorum TaxID=258 RepID=A0A380BKM4_SPHSI|nr:DUF1573 domain-containing protein [Sphingobacterium spiritivorum]SUJ02484.1 Protein of uncharacterised function (DUF1573) [Sphingobacterium spiritivorum]
MKINKLAFAGILSMACLVSACGNNTKTNVAKAAQGDSVAGDTTQQKGQETLGKIEFEETAFDFGQVKEGEVVQHTFTFTNVGEAPVILSEVNASCGCTTPHYSKSPVLPGKKGEVKVAFDSKGQVGKQQKIVTVMSNATNGISTVQLRGEVQKAN